MRFISEVTDREDTRLDEPRLLGRIASGDEAAAAELFRRHGDFVFRVAHGTCGRREDAVEVVQEVFLALIEAAGSLDLRRGRLSTWLYRVARNKAIDSLRRRRAAPVEAAVEVEAASAESQVLARQRHRLLREAIAGLPPRSREVFVLRVGLGLSVAETARLTGTNPGSVRTALHAAKTKLKETIERLERGSGGRHARSRTAER